MTEKLSLPALERLGIQTRIGWHSFRHGFSNLLRQQQVDIKTVQELLRHADSRVTLDIYQQTVTEERRRAQALVFEKLVEQDPERVHEQTVSDIRSKPEPAI